MDRITELDQIEDTCTKWLHDHPKAHYSEWKEVSEKRLIAMKEKTEIFRQQLENIRRNGAEIP